MKKFFKYAYVALVGTVLAGMASCNKDEAFTYEGATISGEQVYISNDLPTNITITDADNKIDVTVMRVNTKGAISVPVEVVCTEAAEGLFTAATSEVAFADGDSAAVLTINFDPTTLIYDDVYAFDVKIADSKLTTPYGISSITYSVTKPAPWTPWCSDINQWVAAGQDPEMWPMSESGRASVTFTYNAYWEGEDPNLPIYYRASTVDPTTAEFRIDDWGNGVSLTILYDPTTTKCRIPVQPIGKDINGTPGLVCDVSTCMNADFSRNYPCNYYAETGKFVLNTIYVTEDLLGTGKAYGLGEEYAQVSGYYVPDYSLGLTYEGILTDASQVPYCLVTTNFGVDVEKAMGVIVEASADADAVADALAAGELEGLELVSGANRAPLGENLGALQFVAVSIAENEVKAVEAVKFFYNGGVPMADVEFQVNLVPVTELFNEATIEANQMYPYNSFGFNMCGKDIASVKTYVNTAAIIDGSGMEPEEICVEYGSEVSAANIEKVNGDGYGSAYIRLNAATEYGMICYVTNTSGNTATYYLKYTTEAAPYSGELVIGDYTMVDAENESAAATKIMPVVGSEKDFLVSGLGIDDGSVWHAEYSSAANTLTLNGFEYGYEEYENQFGGIYGWFNQAQNWVYGYFSFASEESDGSDPVVFSVDPTTHELNGLKTDLLVAVLNNDTQEMIGYYRYFSADGTVVTVGGGEENAPAKLKQAVKKLQVAKMQPKHGDIFTNKVKMFNKAATCELVTRTAAKKQFDKRQKNPKNVTVQLN